MKGWRRGNPFPPGPHPSVVPEMCLVSAVWLRARWTFVSPASSGPAQRDCSRTHTSAYGWLPRFQPLLHTLFLASVPHCGLRPGMGHEDNPYWAGTKAQLGKHPPRKHENLGLIPRTEAEKPQRVVCACNTSAGEENTRGSQSLVASQSSRNSGLQGQ